MKEGGTRGHLFGLSCSLISSSPVAVSVCSFSRGWCVGEGKTDRGAEGVGMGGSMVGLLLPLC